VFTAPGGNPQLTVGGEPLFITNKAANVQLGLLSLSAGYCGILGLKGGSQEAVLLFGNGNAVMDVWDGGNTSRFQVLTNGINTTGSMTVAGITNSGVESGGKGGASSVAINLGASPYTFTAPATGNVQVWLNANVPSTASLTIAMNGTTIFFTAASQAQYPWTILLEPGDSLVFTVSGTGMSYTAGYFPR
jgi:hypothetical protein